MTLITINDEGIFIDGVLQKTAHHAVLDISPCCGTVEISSIEGLERHFKDFKIKSAMITIDAVQVAA